MKRPQKKALLLLNLSLMALLLTGCPIPASNKPLASSNKNAVLLYAAKPDQAVVYIVQPYTIVDWYLVGGAMSDADQYSSSVYIKSPSADYAYIGKLDRRHNLCFYVKPGKYSIKFKNTDSTPATIEQPLSFNANSTRILALERNSYSGGANNKLEFKELSLTEGKSYINRDNTLGCANVSDLSTSVAGKVGVVYSVTFKNETADVWAVYSPQAHVWAGYSPQKVKHEKVAELLQPGDSYTYDSPKITVLNNQFIESGLSVFDSSLNLRKIESSDKRFQNNEETILNNRRHENADAYINIKLPQNQFSVDVNSNLIFPTLQSDVTCRLLKPIPDARVNCVVELRDKSSAKKKG
ncbi:MAG: hypothetical protein K0R48_156 [Gammaproteobacteria bacterium]|jgi:hypothetical protein|nr:hypothetical protein [Gammaproteobacteria bacterium]